MTTTKARLPQTLREQREALVTAMANAYSPDDFPGSREWWECKRRGDAIAAFDAAHPEVAAAVQAERLAARQAHDRQILDGIDPLGV